MNRPRICDAFDCTRLAIGYRIVIEQDAPDSGPIPTRQHRCAECAWPYESELTPLNETTPDANAEGCQV